MYTDIGQQPEPESKKINKKLLLIIFISIFVLSALSIGIYLYISKSSKTYSLNKYPDTNNWCEVNKDGKTLTTECKALLLNISPKSDASCFTIQIISKDNELKNLDICEKGDSLTYTNDILGYKKLMPIDLTFTYSLKGLLNINNVYTFTNVSIKDLDESYTNYILAQDISNLLTLDLSGTTVKNSIDFCPNPNSLPDYISEEQKTDYSTFFDKYSLNSKSTVNQLKENLNGNFANNWDTSSLTILRACDTSDIQNWSGICNTSSTKNWSTIGNVQTLNTTPVWGNTLNPQDVTLINQISLFYDGMYLTSTHQNYNTPSLVTQLIKYMNDAQNVNEEEFCNLGRLFDSLKNNTNIFELNRNYIYGQIYQNIGNFSSATCANMIEDKLDKNGMYIYTYMKNLENQSILSMYNRCLNITNYISNE